MAITSITMRIDEELKNQIQELVSELGLDMTTFFTIYAKQAVRERGIPFEICARIPNAETLEALNEVKAMRENPSLGKAYTDVDVMMKELLG